MRQWSNQQTAERCTVSLHDALPILRALGSARPEIVHSLRVLDPCRPVPDRGIVTVERGIGRQHDSIPRDRKSTRLNSSHVEISYAVFCLKKKSKLDSPWLVSISLPV